jgi:hypothetical protein
MSGLCKRGEIQEQGRIEFRYALPVLDLMIFVENFRQHIFSKLAQILTVRVYALATGLARR